MFYFNFSNGATWLRQRNLNLSKQNGECQLYSVRWNIVLSQAKNKVWVLSFKPLSWFNFSCLSRPGRFIVLKSLFKSKRTSNICKHSHIIWPDIMSCSHCSLEWLSYINKKCLYSNLFLSDEKCLKPCFILVSLLCDKKAQLLPYYGI